MPFGTTAVRGSAGAPIAMAEGSVARKLKALEGVRADWDGIEARVRLATEEFGPDVSSWRTGDSEVVSVGETELEAIVADSERMRQAGQARRSVARAHDASGIETRDESIRSNAKR